MRRLAAGRAGRTCGREHVVRLALAGDTMLGRMVGEALASGPPESLVAPEVVELTRAADLFVLNLECCIAERGSPRPKVFTFRAPPAAVELLLHLGVDCVTLANNHALDYGPEALLETLQRLRAAGIAAVGAGATVTEARLPAVLEADGLRLAALGASDHPEDFAAGPDQAGIALADLEQGVPAWLAEAIGAADADAVLVSPHWGPNMTSAPLSYVRAAARELQAAGATLVAGHSAHVFHGIAPGVLFDLGDFLDDYAVDRVLRNDLGLLFFADLEVGRLERLEAVPLKLEYCFTRLADDEDTAWIRRRLARACAELGTALEEEGGRLVVRA
jgi:poly-gamma-glutamate capsule biosynthesis protein CapA/YwtB (metallophosphatase superfamily)